MHICADVPSRPRSAVLNSLQSILRCIECYCYPSILFRDFTKIKPKLSTCDCIFSPGIQSASDSIAELESSCSLDDVGCLVHSFI